MAKRKSNEDKLNNLLEGLSFLEQNEDSLVENSLENISDEKMNAFTDKIDASISNEITNDITIASNKRYKSDETFKTSAFGRNLTSIYTVEVGSICPHCKFAELEEDISFSGKPCEFFVYCPNCNAHICTYKPMPHQEAFHRDEHPKKLYAGGFGSAKTYTCGMEFITYALQIPNGAGLIGAATWGQVEDTCLKFVLDNMPKALVARSKQDKVSWSMDLINGFKISAKALDKEGKIRSANLNIIWVEEASEVAYNIIVYIMARLRNKTAFFKGKNRLKMLLSSNPDVGWLNTDWLMVSDEVVYHGGVVDRYVLDENRRDPSIVTHISATSANIYLPPDYETNLAKNKPDWWVNRYLKGSFKYTEGLVFPNFINWFCEPFKIPAHWKRITGTDFGRRDPTAHPVAALDPVRKIIYVYDYIEENLDDMSLDDLITKIKKSHDFSDSQLAYPHQCDPRGRNRDQVSGQSWIDAYRARGIILQPAQDCESNSVASTIEKLRMYGDKGRLKIFNTCTKLKDALSKYKYPPRDLGDDKNQGELPMDKNNHGPDAMRYMLSPFPMFPADPSDFDTIWQETMAKFNIKNNPWGTNLLDDGFSDYVGDFMDNFG